MDYATFLGVKWPGLGEDHTSLLEPRLRMDWGYNPSSPLCLHRKNNGVTFTFNKFNNFSNDIVLFYRYVEEVGGVFSNLLFIFFSLNGALMCISVFQASVVRKIVNKYSYPPVENMRHLA